MSAVAYDGRRLGAGIADGGAGVDLEFARAMKEALTYLLSSWIRIASRSKDAREECWVVSQFEFIGP